MKDFINDIKVTKFTQRFIVPKEWFLNLMNSDDKSNINIKIIKNGILLDSKKNKLKKNLDLEKIVIIVYEIMEAIIDLKYDIDYLIIIEYDRDNKSFDFNEIDVIDPGIFYKINPNYEQQIIDKGYFEPHYSKKKINLGESTHELLNKKEENEEEQNMGNTKIININEENRENNKLRGKRNNVKKIESQNDLKNTDDENEENVDELFSNENMNNIGNNFQAENKKEINKDVILINKNSQSKINNNNNQKDEKGINHINKIEKEEEHREKIEIEEEYKKYFFNKETTKMIDLSKFKGESIKPVGLINPSIYCFMISILQSLISIPELNFFFLSKLYLLSSAHNNPDDSNLDENDIEENYPICNSYQYLIKLYLLSKRNYIQIPSNLFRICNRLLGGMHMHDSQEFFVCFLEAIQDELNPSNKDKKKKKIEKKEITMEEKWNEYRLKNNSFIDSVFTGLMRSTVECKTCQHRSITYDPFIDLNVSLNKYKNLEKCLKQYFEFEKIDCEYKCDNCKQISKVSKYLLYYYILFLFRP